jgi:hypothetical protein
MGFLASFLGKNKAAKAAAAADVARGQKLHGHEVGQSPDEIAATRGRMEAEMDAQRRERERATRPDA